MNAAAEGDKAAASSDWKTAIKHYTAALIELPRAPSYYIKRSTAYSRRKTEDGGPDFHAALGDIELALALARDRGNRELILDAQIRRAITLFQLQRYGDARFLLGLVGEKLGVKDEVEQDETTKAENRSVDIKAAMAQNRSNRHKDQLSIWKRM